MKTITLIIAMALSASALASPKPPANVEPKAYAAGYKTGEEYSNRYFEGIEQWLLIWTANDVSGNRKFAGLDRGSVAAGFIAGFNDRHVALYMEANKKHDREKAEAEATRARIKQLNDPNVTPIPPHTHP
jgi:hypothetical protein